MAEQDEMVILINKEKMEEATPNPRKGKLFFEGPFKDTFWAKVSEFPNLPWSEALAEAHYDRAIKLAEAAEVEPPVYMIVNVVDEFWNSGRPRDQLMEFFPSYEKQITRVVTLILDREEEAAGGPGKSEYKYALEPDDEYVSYTVLHHAARQNLEEIVKIMLKKYPGLQNVQTEGLKPEKYPVEYALEKKNDGINRDGTAAILIASMYNERVRSLFESDPDCGVRVSFVDLAVRPEMKRTISEVLNSLINPDWPYVLVKEGQEESLEKLWQSDPNLPIRYHFFYQILDQDEEGRAPKILDPTTKKLKDNPKFNHRSTSGLKALSYGPNRKFASKHPVIRQLIDLKWCTYGSQRIWVYFGMYLFFLALLTASLLLAGHSKNPSKYDKKSVDLFRGFCEIGVLIFSVVYVIDEVSQMESERGRYFKDFYNWLDLFGLFLIFLIVPLRILDVRLQWCVASLAFIINFIRGSKYLLAWKNFGVYARVLIEIIKRDLSIFMAYYAIIFCGFSGGIYFAMKGTSSLSKVNGFPDILLRGARAVFEGKEFADDYDGFNWFVLIVILVDMLIVLLLLLNMFIAQLSNRYEKAAEEAAVQYDVDKITLVCRVENSKFRPLNLRCKFYKDGDYINDIEKIQEYVSVWKDTVAAFGLKDKKALLEDAQAVWTKENLIRAAKS